ncbi:DAK2 domain-containing protein [Aeromicrobium sp. SMF47]|uniref:DAK2 domain-containing protein n=1 Tax=Aeromicrobium yanjiei TaxID=2662028 RepID=A0A5Q2MLU4_9ACTN|nr:MULTISPECIES: DAK2 domain-containing protein [Aeromicrobium]MRJ77968.1 DAK2 domain-containing protein [Aeromicrobium yanjiei]MRK02328.1 DAK2 domain-containing protein [Aeromicrobium sp. S22]QGG40950.1 DAK2 domain-containing protein [Aeromicrobium yanjiei]
MGLTLSAAGFRAWTQLCAGALSSARAEIDALNVFPVPDGDTGTNAYLTFMSGADAVEALGPEASFEQLVKTYVDGLLTGAKGNTGVILSQLVRACFRDLSLVGPVEAADVARAFVAASDAAWAAVGAPVEGTILSVAKAAAVGAEDAAEAGVDGRTVFGKAATAAREALARTPSQMEVLARAGVVDAGGRALVVVLDATEQALTGRIPEQVRAHVPQPIRDADDLLSADGPSYEVMYLLEADDDRIPGLRTDLMALGDSLVVVGGERLWNVHVHVDDVGAAIEAGIAAGRPYRIAVTHFADQVARGPQKGRVVITATTGAGLTALCEEAGARTLEFTRDTPLTVAEMSASLRDVGADEIIVLPNNFRYIRQFEAAAQAARQDGVRVAVIPTNAQVQGLAALAVHDPGLGFDEVVVAMSSAAAHTQHGAVTVATEHGITMAGPVGPGDVLGVVTGDFTVIGDDVLEVAYEVIDKILSPAGEMVTVVLGEGSDPSYEASLRAYLRTIRPDVDLLVYDGGQENYPLFIAVE